MKARALGFLVMLACIPIARASLTIDGTFDASLNVAEQGAISSAISVVEADITSPNNLTVKIYFTSTGTGLGESITPDYATSYYAFYNALQAVATQPDQMTAVASLGAAPTGPSSGSPVNGITAVDFTSAEGRNLGFSTPGSITVGAVTNYDGEIVLNTSITTPGGGSYSLESVAMHEIDEVLGIGGPGSNIGSGSQATAVRPLDLFRYSAAGVRSYTTSDANQPYFSINGGNTAISYFNQAGGGSDYADWQSAPDHSGFPVQVQDAFATAGQSPVLDASEITAFNAIGYDSNAPEPATLGLVGLGAIGIVTLQRRRQRG